MRIGPGMHAQRRHHSLIELRKNGTKFYYLKNVGDSSLLTGTILFSFEKYNVYINCKLNECSYYLWANIWPASIVQLAKENSRSVDLTVPRSNEAQSRSFTQTSLDCKILLGWRTYWKQFPAAKYRLRGVFSNTNTKNASAVLMWAQMSSRTYCIAQESKVVK